jgi:glycine C-acetyltransferase
MDFVERPDRPSGAGKRFEDFVPAGGNADIFAKVEALSSHLAAEPAPYLDGLGLQMLGPAAHECRIREHDGREHGVIMLGSNSYLGLTTHPAVVAASKDACDRYGYGMGAVSLYAGTTPLHRRVENELSAIYSTEDAIVFPCGYSANVGIISALCGPGDVIVNDAANHASIFDGCRLSGAGIKVYLHRNMAHLERTLARIPDSTRGRLIVTDGVFSMDGDLAPLDRIADLAARYGARVMVDDAHGLGVVGPTGRGTAERFGCLDRVDLLCGTLSKTAGAIGGYCAGSAAVVRYLRYYARTYFFSTGMPAPVAAGLAEALRMIREDKAGRDALWMNIKRLRGGLAGLGFDTGDTESAIIPVIVGDEAKLAAFHNELREEGVFTNLVTYPAVRRKECRLRVSVMGTLTASEIDRALSVFAETGRRHGIIG